MRCSIAVARGAWIAAALGCSNTTTGTNNGGSGALAFEGTYAATYAGVYTITSPITEAQGSVAESGTFVISAPTPSTIDVEATFTGAGGISGVCEGTGDVNGSTAASSPTDESCTYAVTGGKQTNVGSSAFTLSGSTVTDLVSGTFTGMNGSGAYGGTFSGTWTLTRQQ